MGNLCSLNELALYLCVVAFSRLLGRLMISIASKGHFYKTRLPVSNTVSLVECINHCEVFIYNKAKIRFHMLVIYITIIGGTRTSDVRTSS